MEGQLMFQFPGVTCIPDGILYNALKDLDSDALKVFIWCWAEMATYEETGSGCVMHYIETLIDDLSLDREQIVSALLTLRQRNYIDILCVSPQMVSWAIWTENPLECQPPVFDEDDKWQEEQYGTEIAGTKVVRVLQEDRVAERKRTKSYYQSARWRALRLQVLERDRFACTKCGATDDLCVHHLSYANKGHEELEELVTLCRSCHAARRGVKPKEVSANV